MWCRCSWFRWCGWCRRCRRCCVDEIKIEFGGTCLGKALRRSFRAKVVLQMCCFCYLCCFQQTSEKKKKNLTQCGAIPKLRRTKFFSIFMFLFSGNLQKTVVALWGAYPKIPEKNRFRNFCWFWKFIPQFEKTMLFSIFAIFSFSRKSPLFLLFFVSVNL